MGDGAPASNFSARPALAPTVSANEALATSPLHVGIDRPNITNGSCNHRLGAIWDDMTQRDKMRELFRRFGGDRTQVVRAYADAERRGEVERVRDSNDLRAEDYASRLFADGIQKRWLQQ